MKKVGIMGGTFNPIHNGHLLIAESAYEQLGLDEVRFIPTGRSPHKQGQQILDSADRMHMVELAIADNPAFVVDDREVRSDRLSYSYLTLEQMHAEYPEYKLYFIIIECGRELVNEAAAGGHTGRGARSERKKAGLHF